MSKPSNQELASLVDMANQLLTRQRVKPATFEELHAAREKIKVAVKNLVEKDQHNSQLHMLKKYKLALKIKLDVIGNRERTQAN